MADVIRLLTRPDQRSAAARPRDDVILEYQTAPGVFTQAEGPFAEYERRVGPVSERIAYRLSVPWFAWVFAPLMRRHLVRQPRTGRQPWWAPGDRLDASQVLVLGLLAAASLIVGFTNTLFTQTLTFAAKDFGVGQDAQGIAAAVVRWGILLVIPLAVLGDRIGRRRVIVWCAWASPLIASLGALAPNLVVLTATQTVARPLGLCLDLLVAVVAAEVMPKNSRAYAVGVLSLATGLGAGVCVWALRLADLDVAGWRYVYVVALVLLIPALDLARRLPESPRFIAAHDEHPPTPRRRLFVLCAVGFFGNLFVAPASVFQNDYLKEVRGFSGGRVALFTIATATPAAIGILVGGWLADRYGRRIIGACAVVGGAGLITVSYFVNGAPMWIAALSGGIVGGAAVPALSVYRAELFPTGRRSTAGLIVTITALLSGSITLILAGRAINAGYSYGSVMATLYLGQFVVAAIVLTSLPETAHRELEELNPADAAATAR